MTAPSLRQRTTPESASIPDLSQRQAPAAAPTMLRHTRAGVLALRGPRSGRSYLFSDREAIAVLAEDVDVLLRTGALERAS
jgi:hypothetical protein